MVNSFYKGDWNINKTTHITMDENEIVTPEAETAEEEVESNEVEAE